MKKISLFTLFTLFTSTFIAAAMVLFPLATQAQITFVSPAHPMSPCLASIQSGLSFGMSDSTAVGSNTTPGAIANLQQFLNSNGYLKVSPTGYFGSLTLAAVKEFQAENGVPTTGYVGPLTVAVADKYSCSGTLGTSAGSGTSSGAAGNPISSNTSGAITVSAPAASSTLNRGAYQNITWNQTPPQTFAAGSEPANTTIYDVYLQPLPLQCASGQICPMYMLAPFPIAGDVDSHGNYQISWPWIVATSTPGGPGVTDGQYKIQVCAVAVTLLDPTGTDANCAQSGTFTIAN